MAVCAVEQRTSMRVVVGAVLRAGSPVLDCPHTQQQSLSQGPEGAENLWEELLIRGWVAKCELKTGESPNDRPGASEPMGC